MEIEELLKLHRQIKDLAYGERFGANYQDYKPNINYFENLVYKFYETVGELKLPIKIMQEIMDGQESLTSNFLTLRSNLCTNKFEQMKLIFSEIDQITNDTIKFLSE